VIQIGLVSCSHLQRAQGQAIAAIRSVVGGHQQPPLRGKPFRECSPVAGLAAVSPPVCPQRADTLPVPERGSPTAPIIAQSAGAHVHSQVDCGKAGEFPPGQVLERHAYAVAPVPERHAGGCFAETVQMHHDGVRYGVDRPSRPAQAQAKIGIVGSPEQVALVKGAHLVESSPTQHHTVAGGVHDLVRNGRELVHLMDAHTVAVKELVQHGAHRVHDIRLVGEHHPRGAGTRRRVRVHERHQGRQPASLRHRVIIEKGNQTPGGVQQPDVARRTDPMLPVPRRRELGAECAAERGSLGIAAVSRVVVHNDHLGTGQPGGAAQSAQRFGQEVENRSPVVIQDDHRDRGFGGTHALVPHTTSVSLACKKSSSALSGCPRSDSPRRPPMAIDAV